MTANVHKQKEPGWYALEIRKVMDGLKWRMDEAETKTSREID